MYPKPIKEFIEKFSKLPGIGPRQAARLAFWLLNNPKNNLQDLKKALEGLDTEVQICPSCFFTIDGSISSPRVGSASLTTKEKGGCHFCDNPGRDYKTICVVEKETDLATVEKSGGYKGLYHVLGGLFSAMDTAIPKQLKMPELVNRIQNSLDTEEVILALSPTHEGDLTAYYLERLLKPLKVKVTRLGRGLPYGSDVEFADAQTLSGALESRRETK